MKNEIKKILQWWNKIILLDEPKPKKKAPVFITKSLFDSLQLNKNGSYSD